jgi:hypothetical protein
MYGLQQTRFTVSKKGLRKIRFTVYEFERTEFKSGSSTRHVSSDVIVGLIAYVSFVQGRDCWTRFGSLISCLHLGALYATNEVLRDE